MKPLTEEQFDLCQQYLNMVSCIDEGFTYVSASFLDFSKTEGDVVLSDILQALTLIAHVNTLLERLLAEDESIQQAITHFQNVMAQAFKLEGQFDRYDTKMKIINDFLYPAFSAWSDSIQNALGEVCFTIKYLGARCCSKKRL